MLDIGELLLQLAAEAVAPVVAALPAVAGFAAEKAVNRFGPPIAKRLWEWLRGKPRKEQEEALAELASVNAAQAAPLAREGVRQHAPQADPQAQELAVRYLSALPGAVRRSLVTDPAKRSLSLPLALDLQESASLLPLLPISAPPFEVPGDLPGSNYYLEEVVGTGGFGAVYRARSKDTTQQYLRFAIKVCLDREMQMALAALQNELENLKRLQETTPADWSDRIVRLFGYRLDPPPFLVYEFVPGGDLASHLARRQREMGGRVGADEVRGWIVQILEGLAFAHAHGLIHRDLKPANVLVARGGLKLTDFGLGGVVSEHARTHSQIRVSAANLLPPDEKVSLFRGSGTPLYMSPEQRAYPPPAPDPRHDLYSLGVLWYQLLLGDVSKEFHPGGWDQELTEECPGIGDQIDLIRRCVGLMKFRPKDAGQLLDLMRKPPSPPPSIRIESLHPQPVKVGAGSSAVVTVRVARQNFNGPLTVGVEELPTTVTARPSPIQAQLTESQVHLTAHQNAAPGTANARIIVRGSEVQGTARLSIRVTPPPSPPPPPASGGIWPHLSTAALPGNQGRWLVYLEADELPYDGQWWHFSYGKDGVPDPFCLTNARGQQTRQPEYFARAQEIWDRAKGRMPCSAGRGLKVNRDQCLRSFWQPELGRLNHTVKVGGLLHRLLGNRFTVLQQLLPSLRWYQLDLQSETDPYIAVLSGGQQPALREVELLVEVRKPSLQYAKARNFTAEMSRFANGKVREVWVIDLDAQEVTVHRQPQGNRYTQVTSHHQGKELNPEVAVDVPVAVDVFLNHEQESF
jgi:serine/threonine protein kinase